MDIITAYADNRKPEGGKVEIILQSTGYGWDAAIYIFDGSQGKWMLRTLHQRSCIMDALADLEEKILKTWKAS